MDEVLRQAELDEAAEAEQGNQSRKGEPRPESDLEDGEISEQHGSDLETTEKDQHATNFPV